MTIFPRDLQSWLIILMHLYFLWKYDGASKLARDRDGWCHCQRHVGIMDITLFNHILTWILQRLSHYKLNVNCKTHTLLLLK